MTDEASPLPWPSAIPFPVELARQHGITAEFLHIGTLTNEEEIMRFARAYVHTADPLDEQAEHKVFSALMLGKIIAVSTRLINPKEEMYSVSNAFYRQPNLRAIAYGWFAAVGTRSETLYQKGPNDEIRLIVEPPAPPPLSTDRTHQLLRVYEEIPPFEYLLTHMQHSFRTLVTDAQLKLNTHLTEEGVTVCTTTPNKLLKAIAAA